MSYANNAVEAPAIQLGRSIDRGVSRLRALAGRIYAIWQAGRKRSGNLTRLDRLNDHVLTDVGLSRAEIGVGATESFWHD